MNTKLFNEILLRRRNKLNIASVVLDDLNEDNIEYVSVICKNVESLGYTFDKELFNILRYHTKEYLNDFYKELVSCLKEYVGASVEYHPYYENFPTCMMDGSISDLELITNAIVHYISGGTLYADYAKDERLPLFESPDLTVLSLGINKDLDEVMNNLITSKTSLSDTDKADMIWLIQNKGVDYTKLPDEIPFKENVAAICKLIMDNTSEVIWYNVLHKYLKTATDILRFVTYLSDGDVSLASNTKYKSFSRKHRRLILRLLDTAGNIEEDMLRYKTKWIRLGERLHPSKYKEFNNVCIAFDKLRNNGDIVTFNGKIDKAILDRNIKEVLSLLKIRPGEFARRLDDIIRDNITNAYSILSEFESIADKISVPVLLQVREHFAYRCDKNDSRVFFPKGSLAKVYTISNELKDIPKNICNEIIGICEAAIIEQFKSKESLGKVYIDDSIKGYCVPQSQRSASKSLKPVTRGSRLPISKNTKSCRGFIWWKNCDNYDSDIYYSNGRVDIDLSAAILDENFNYLSHISYTNLRDVKFRACHSGDITNGGNLSGKGVAEFIDVDIDSVVNNGGRYIIYQVYSFTGQKYSDIPHAMFGFMEREDVNSGEVFEPSTVEQRIDLTAETTTAIPVLFDCVTREYIWMDIAGNINNINRVGANLEGNLRGVSAMCYGIVHGNKPQMYDLALLNAESRGEIVEDRNEADTIFDINTDNPKVVIEKTIEVQNEKGEVIDTRVETEEKVKDCRIITPYDIDIWMSEMM